MSSDLGAVRTTRPPFLAGKNLLLGAALAAVVLFAIALLLWFAAIPRSLYPVRVNGRYGYITKAAKLSIEPQFDGAAVFTDGLAAVAIGNKWGYIDHSGKLAIAPQYDLADPFSEGLALVGAGPHLG